MTSRPRRSATDAHRALAERLGYRRDDLDAIPAAAIESFAGVGYVLDLAVIKPGEAVLDLGSGSGTDGFPAAIAAVRLGASPEST